MSKVRLGDVAIEVRETSKNPEGLPVVGLEHLLPGEITLTQWSEATDNTFTKLFHKGQILFGRRRAYLKKAAVAPFNGVCSGDITVIAAKPEKLLPDLLPFIISNDAFFDYAMEKSAGSLSPRVKWAQLAEYGFDLPELEEQRKLANLLWAMERTRKAYQDLLAQTDELVKSQFVEMFGTIETPRYGVKTVAETCTIKSGTTFPSEAKLSEGEIIYAKVSDMNLPGNEVYIQTSKQYVSSTTAGKTIIPAGAVVFPKRGAAIATNKKRILQRATCVDLNTMGLIPGDEILTVYLYGYLSGIDLMSLADGSTIPQLNNRQIGPLRIIVPPVAEQECFARLFYEADKSKLAIRQTLESLEKSRSAIMTKVFG